MSRQTNKLTTIKGCALWALDPATEQQLIAGSVPQADNITITLPELTFGTTDVNILGTLTLPDFTRIDNFTVSANIAVDNPDSKPLKKVGLQAWKITYVVGCINQQTGEEEYTPYTVYCKGYIGSIPLSSVEQGGDGMADISMNCTAIRKMKGNEVEFEIDRLGGSIKLGDKDYSRDINSLY